MSADGQEAGRLRHAAHRTSAVVRAGGWSASSRVRPGGRPGPPGSDGRRPAHPPRAGPTPVGRPPRSRAGTGPAGICSVTVRTPSRCARVPTRAPHRRDSGCRRPGRSTGPLTQPLPDALLWRTHYPANGRPLTWNGGRSSGARRPGGRVLSSAMPSGWDRTRTSALRSACRGRASAARESRASNSRRTAARTPLSRHQRIQLRRGDVDTETEPREDGPNTGSTTDNLRRPRTMVRQIGTERRGIHAERGGTPAPPRWRSARWPRRTRRRPPRAGPAAGAGRLERRGDHRCAAGPAPR
jgi:hypothetical protein